MKLRAEISAGRATMKLSGSCTSASVKCASAPGALAESAIKDSTAAGLEPAVLAERTIGAIRENVFYVLSEDDWMRSCESRIEDILKRRNPVLRVPGASSAP